MQRILIVTRQHILNGRSSNHITTHTTTIFSLQVNTNDTSAENLMYFDDGNGDTHTI
jgi:hypothetical protein